MDTWYNELVGGNAEDISRAADILTNNVKQRSFDINLSLIHISEPTRPY